jgi:hypothetical protein
MKVLFVICLFLFSTIGSASESSLNLDKFKAEAQAELGRAFGDDGSLSDGEIIYWDGVGSTNLPPLFDFSALYYMTSPSIPLSNANQKIAYRLFLYGNADVVMPLMVEEEKILVIMFPRSYIVSFRQESTPHQQETLINKYQAQFPALNFSHLPSVNALLVSGTALEAYKLSEKLKGESLVEAVTQDGEMYRAPYEFDQYRRLDQQSGVINVDSLRTISAEYKEIQEFAFWTNIPERLR